MDAELALPNNKLLNYWRQADFYAKLNQPDLMPQDWHSVSINRDTVANGAFSSAALQALNLVFISCPELDREIMVAPIWYTAPSGNGFAPFWLRARVSMEGQLQPLSNFAIPWIPPVLFDSVVASHYAANPTLADHLIQEYLLEQSPNTLQDWPTYYALCCQAMKEILGIDLARSYPEYVAQDGLLLMAEPTAQCQRTVPSQPCSKLLNTYMQVDVVAPVASKDEFDDYCAHWPHQAVLKGQALQALKAALDLTQGALTPLITPPGTNYYQIIKEYMACKLVDAAVKQYPMPLIGVIAPQPLMLTLLEDLQGSRYLAANIDALSPYREPSFISHFIKQCQPSDVQLDNLPQLLAWQQQQLTQQYSTLKHGFKVRRHYQHKYQEIQQHYGSPEQLELKIKQLQDADSKLDQSYQHYSEALANWKKTQQHGMVGLLKQLLPGAQQRAQRQIEGFMVQHQLTLDPQQAPLPFAERLAQQLRHLKVKRAKLHNQLVDLCDAMTTLNGAKQQWLGWLNAQHLNHSALHSWDSMEKCLEEMLGDLGEKLLHSALHYWETQFLLALEHYPKITQFEALPLEVQAMHRLVFTITPASGLLQNLVSSQLMLETLIVAKANEILPMNLLPWLNYSQKAWVMGDLKLLPPPMVCSSLYDSILAMHHGLAQDDNDLEHLYYQGYLLSSGNVLAVALGVAAAQTDSYDPPMMLNMVGHNAKIYEYSQKYIYANQLIFTQKNVETGFFPSLAYIHVRGSSTASVDGLSNLLEAQTIIEWLKLNKPYAHNRSIAIITLYQAQKNLLQTLVAREALSAQVFCLNQTSQLQADIVLFCPVYTSTDAKPYLLDEGEQWLNLALTRATESFLMIADMGIFNATTHSPSGNLAKLLFKSAQQRVLQIPAQAQSPQLSPPSQRLVGLAAHQQMAKEMLEKVQHSLTVVSSIVVAQCLEKLITALSVLQQKGVSCDLYFSDIAISGYHWKNSETSKLIDRLIQLGVTIHIVQGLHSNALWYDEQCFIEGTCPWLAMCEPFDDTHGESISLSYRQPIAAGYIAEFLSQLKIHQRRTLSSTASPLEAITCES